MDDLISPVYCPQCKKAIPADADYCPYCGAAATIQTRRQEQEQRRRQRVEAACRLFKRGMHFLFCLFYLAYPPKVRKAIIAFVLIFAVIIMAISLHKKAEYRQDARNIVSEVRRIDDALDTGITKTQYSELLGEVNHKFKELQRKYPHCQYRSYYLIESAVELYAQANDLWEEAIDTAVKLDMETEHTSAFYKMQRCWSEAHTALDAAERSLR